MLKSFIQFIRSFNDPDVLLSAAVRKTYRQHGKCRTCGSRFKRDQPHAVYLIRYCKCHNRIVIQLSSGRLIEGENDSTSVN